jgi:protein disulfide-isomerase
MRRAPTGLAVVIMLTLGVQAVASDWETDYARASTNASKSGLYMLLDFSGSDWCGWCMKLDGEVFSTAEFKKYAKEKLVCVVVDFPRQKKQSKKLKEQNAELAKKYGVTGYPTVVVLSPAGELVDTTGYQEGGARKYVDSLKEMIARYEKQHPKKEAVKKPASPKPDTGDGG